MSSTPAKGWLPRRIASVLLREPLVHFFVLGAMLFAAHGTLAKSSHGEPALESTRCAKPSRVIRVTSADLEALRSDFRRSWKRDPSPEQLGDLVEEFVVDEVLFREGEALGLDRDDAMVRQRVIEKMRVLARPEGQARQPSREELLRWFDEHPHRFRQGAKIAFDQLYFDPKRHRGPGQDAGAAALAALAALTSQAPTEPAPKGVGDGFVLRGSWEETPEQQIVNVFGENFASAAMLAPPGVWQGPVRSDYGEHLLRVLHRRPARMPAFDEVESYVRADWQMVETRAIGAVERNLLPGYRVELQGRAVTALENTPGLRTLLRAKP